MPLQILLLILGFVLLVKGAHFLVDGATNMARRLGVSSLVIGLTVVAFGTSVPELAVSTLAAWRGATQVALGNVLGSNIGDIALILGAGALIRPLAVGRSTTWKEIPIALVAVVLVTVLSFDSHFMFGALDSVTRQDGLILLLFFAGFIYYMYTVGRKQRDGLFNRDELKNLGGEKKLRWGSILLYIVAGFAMVMGGGQLVLSSAIFIARSFGLSEAYIGLTITAVGTYMPELITSITAAYRNQADIAVGNIVGSVIVNALLVLGTAALIHPLSVDPVLWADSLFLVGLTLALLVFSALKKHMLTRSMGAFFLMTYVAYILYISARQGLL